MSNDTDPLSRRQMLTMAWREGSARSNRWIRPPFALPEPQFRGACTRCGDCIDACPHGVIFALPAKLGPQVENTPALDLLNKGCHLCEDWPCVTACEPEALKLPELEEGAPPAVPRLALAEVDTEACLAYLGPECGACAHVCPIPGALTWENGTKPVIKADLCNGCALCSEACIVDPKAIKISADLEKRDISEQAQA